jgi:hypothetical protein
MMYEVGWRTNIVAPALIHHTSYIILLFRLRNDGAMRDADADADSVNS